MRTIGVVTGSRSDYGCLVPILRQIRKSPGLRLRLLVTGAHLVREFGLTVREIEADGFGIDDRVKIPLSSDAPEGIARSMGAAVGGFAKSFARVRPDLLLLLGDRFEVQAAAAAAVPFKVPVAHVHGGEVSFGAMDDLFRHSITKLSHLHFAATEAYAKRILQMGEEPWRVAVSGAPGLDHLQMLRLPSKEEIGERLGDRFSESPLLVTFHPATLEYEETPWQVEQLLQALEELRRPTVFTAPNADTSHRAIREKIGSFVKSRRDFSTFVPHLGTALYFGLMRIAGAMVGNSSSGLVEAPSFGLPVVNIGTRQEGRLRAENVIDVGYRKEEILSGIQRALSADFRSKLHGMKNPYGDGQASQRIVQRLGEIPLDDRLIRKRFVDFSSAPAEVASCAASS